MQYVGDLYDLKNIAACNKLLRRAVTVDMVQNCQAQKRKKHGRAHIRVQVSRELTTALAGQPFEQTGNRSKIICDPIRSLNRACRDWTRNEWTRRNRVLGSDLDLTRHILQYVMDTKTLLILSQVNKCLREAIEVSTVVACALQEGGKPMKAIMQIYPAMTERKAYPPDGRRLLRLCHAKRCEFCFNQKVEAKHCIGQFHRDDSLGNPKRTIPRADNCTFSCWNCQSQYRNPHVAKGWKHPCLTRKYQKVIYNKHSKKWYLKKAYLDHRRSLYEVFNHSRSVAKPYFKRWHRPTRHRDNNGRIIYVPTTTPAVVRERVNDGNEIFWNANRVTNDGCELVWSAPTKDASGIDIGPLLNHTLIPSAVEYLNTPGNKGMDHFYDHVMPSPPKLHLYEEFVLAYDRAIAPVLEREAKRKAERSVVRITKQYERLEWTIKAVARVAKHITLHRLKRACRKATWFQNSMPADIKGVRTVQRLLLLYREDHRYTTKSMIKFNTGRLDLNSILHSVLQPVLEEPFKFVSTVGAASEVANRICDTLVQKGILHLGVYRNRTCTLRFRLFDSNGDVRETFGRNIVAPSLRLVDRAPFAFRSRENERFL